MGAESGLVTLFGVLAEPIGLPSRDGGHELNGHSIERDGAAGANGEADIRAVTSQQLHESHHTPMPCLVAPTGTDRAPQAKLNSRVGDGDRLVALTDLREQHTTLQ